MPNGYLTLLVYQLQPIGLQNPLNLITRMHRPRPRRIQLHIRPPVLQSLTRLANFLIGQRDVVMSIAVSGRELQRRVVSLDCLSDASSLIQHIAQIEISQSVARIDRNRGAVMLLRQSVILPVVMQRAQVDMRRRVLGIQLQNPLISRNRLSLRMRIFFKRDALRENPSHIRGNRSRPAHRGSFAGYNFIPGREIEHELSGNRLKQPACMAESHPMPGAKRARLKQWILHSRSLLLHGIERAANDRRFDFAGAQVTNFLDLQQVEKGIALGGGYQFGFFPSCQLTRREPKYSQQLCTTIAVHGCKGAFDHYYPNLRLGLQVEIRPYGNLKKQLATKAVQYPRRPGRLVQRGLPNIEIPI